jgi:hypothetical protein
VVTDEIDLGGEDDDDQANMFEKNIKKVEEGQAIEHSNEESGDKKSGKDK